MHKQIYVNLPVRDVARTQAFYASVGFRLEPKFSNDSAVCMQVGDNIFAMLLHESFFKTFTPKPLVDAREMTEVLVCLSCDSREEVDDLVKKAVAAGGKPLREPQDHGFMYGHGFEDPDGHGWELMYMDPNAPAPHG